MLVCSCHKWLYDYELICEYILIMLEHMHICILFILSSNWTSWLIYKLTHFGKYVICDIGLAVRSVRFISVMPCIWYLDWQVCYVLEQELRFTLLHFTHPYVNNDYVANTASSPYICNVFEALCVNEQKPRRYLDPFTNTQQK